MSARIVLPLIFGLIMTASLHWLGASNMSAMSPGLIPVVLGWLGVMQNLAYTATGISFVCACVHSADPALYQQLSTIAAQLLQHTSELATSGHR